MYCEKCGALVQAGQNYCSACGKPLGQGTFIQQPQSVSQQPGRVDRHVRLLAILWIVISAMLLVPGIGLLIVEAIRLPFAPWPMRTFAFPFGLAVGGLFIASAIAGFAAGWGLLERRHWARPLALVVGVLALPSVPFGTILGIYTLWVLLPADSDQEYHRLSRVAG